MRGYLHTSTAAGVLAVSTLLSVAGPAIAQESAVAQENAGAEAIAGDIIVTATQRQTLLSDVPVAVSAVTSAQLSDSGVTDVRALNQLVPSLLVSGSTSEQVFAARVRGIGTVGDNPGLESSVALFVDGVYRSRTGAGLGELGEVERIEVLRGPQGTLFGRNASAGLINVVTRKPAFETYAYLNATYGNYDQRRLEGGVNANLVPGRLAGKLEGVWVRRDGYVDDVASDRSFNNRNRWLLRGQLLFEPDDRLSLRLSGDFTRQRENCCAPWIAPAVAEARAPDGSIVFGPNPLLGILRGLGSEIEPGAPFRLALTPGRVVRADTDNGGVSGEVNWDLGSAHLVSITAWRSFTSVSGYDADYDSLDILYRDSVRNRFRTVTQELRLQGNSLSGRLDWLLGGYFADERLRLSNDDLTFGADSERFGDCLVAASLAPTSVNPALPRCTTLPATVWPGFAGVAALAGVPRLPGTGIGDGSYFQQNSRNYAFFTHNVVDLVRDRLSLTLGARYTHEEKNLDSAFNNTNLLCTALRMTASPAAAYPCAVNSTAGPGFAAGSPGTKISEQRWTGTAVLGWTPVEGLLLYGSWSSGYKAGGFNLDSAAVDIACDPAAGTPAEQGQCRAQLALPANQAGNARPEAVDLQFAPETVQAFELGAKYATRGLSASLAVFREAFSNFQLNTFNGLGYEVANVQACKDDLHGADSDGSALTGSCAADRRKAGVVSQGVELELTASPARDLTVSAALTYLDTKYSRNLVGTNGRPLSPTLFQLPGRQISNAPPYVVTGSVSWTPRLSDRLRGLAYLDYRLQSNNNTGSDLDLEKVQEAYVLLNGRLGISTTDGRWALEFWGQNLLNQTYFQLGADQPVHGSGTFRSVAGGLAASANGMFILFPGEPRMFGVTGRVRF